MPLTSASARYNKKTGQDGNLVLAQKKDFLFWTPKDTPSAPPSVTIPTKDITNVQATPPTAKTPALKIFLGESAHTFHFSHSQSALEELERVKAPLADIIAKQKAAALPLASGSGTPIRNGTVDGKSAAMAMAKAAASKPEEIWYDDEKLLGDTALQGKVLAKDSALKDRLSQAVINKPQGVSTSQVQSQFWRSRLHILRQYAINEEQQQGVYNVLPTIKFEDKPVHHEDGRTEWVQTLKIAQEEVRLIFKHHPLIATAYDELTPGSMTGNEFWAQFFKSRLLKYVKGERILESDPRYPLLDRYLDHPREPNGGNPLQTGPVPNWMNLAGNEQNHSQKKGNRPDFDMRPSTTEKTPVLKILNTLSEKMMAHVAMEDSEAHAPIGVDEETYDKLRLQDLARQDVDNRVVLDIREQQRYVGTDMDDLSAEAKLYAQQDPHQVLSTLRSALKPSHLRVNERGTLKLDQAVGYDIEDDSDSEDEEASPGQTDGNTPKKKKVSLRVGSHAAMSSATSNIIYSVKQHRQAISSDPNPANGFTQSTFDNLTMTHNTTTEFLHYFWSIFLSGDATRAEELEKLVSTLNNSMTRINAVAKTAEVERNRRIDQMKQEDEAHFKRTNRRRYKASQFERVPGGEKAVMEMVRPTVEAIKKAEQAYRKAYEEQTKARAAGAGAAGAAAS